MQDRTEITDLVHRYAQAIDARNLEQLLSCLAEDAVLLMNSGQVRLEGRAAIGTYMQETFSAEGPLRPSVPSTHIMSNVLVEVSGDKARVETTAVTFRADGETVVIRGVHYTDDCIRTGCAWRILRREHRPKWESAVPGHALA